MLNLIEQQFTPNQVIYLMRYAVAKDVVPGSPINVAYEIALDQMTGREYMELTDFQLLMDWFPLWAQYLTR